MLRAHISESKCPDVPIGSLKSKTTGYIRTCIIFLILIVFCSVFWGCAGSQINDAAAGGDYDQLKKLLAEKDRNPATEVQINSSLWEAAREGRYDIVKLLLENGAKVDHVYTNNITPLVAAAGNGHLAIVRELITQGADVNVSVIHPDYHGHTPLFDASMGGHLKVVEELIAEGADVNVRVSAPRIAGYTPLIIAAVNGHLETVEKLILSGADPNVLSLNGSSALYAASEQGKKDMAVVLLKAGAKVNQPPFRGTFSPLLAAAVNERTEVVQLLLESGADVDAVNLDETSHLVWAIANGYFSAARMLVENGADPDPDDPDGLTPLIMAISKEEPELVKLLVKYRADIYRPDGNDVNPMDAAIKSGSKKIIKTLEKKRAKKPSGILTAIRTGNLEKVRRYMKKHQDPDKPDIRGDTLLHHAVKARSTEVVQYLIKNGADLNALNLKGLSPVHLAGSLDQEVPEEFTALLSAGARIEEVKGRSQVNAVTNWSAGLYYGERGQPEKASGTLLKAVGYLDEMARYKDQIISMIKGDLTAVENQLEQERSDEYASGLMDAFVTSMQYRVGMDPYGLDNAAYLGFKEGQRVLEARRHFLRTRDKNALIADLARLEVEQNKIIQLKDLGEKMAGCFLEKDRSLEGASCMELVD